MEEMSNMAEGMVTMLNREKFAKEIMDLALKHTTVAITADGKIRGCRDISCFDCKFYKPGNCRTAFKDWLDSEYKETEIDWDKVPVDTPVFVWADSKKNLKRRYFSAYAKSDSLYETFDNGATSWTACTTSRWKHCELAKVEDKQKYAKGVEY